MIYSVVVCVYVGPPWHAVWSLCIKWCKSHSVRVSTCHLSVSTHHMSVSTCHLSVSTRHLSVSTSHRSVLTCHLSVSTRHLSVSTSHLSVLTRHHFSSDLFSRESVHVESTILVLLLTEYIPVHQFEQILCELKFYIMKKINWYFKAFHPYGRWFRFWYMCT